MKSKYKVHGNYGPLYEIVTAGLELESEVELYFSADNNMAEQSRTRWNRTQIIILPTSRDTIIPIIPNILLCAASIFFIFFLIQTLQDMYSYLPP